MATFTTTATTTFGPAIGQGWSQRKNCAAIESGADAYMGKRKVYWG